MSDVAAVIEIQPIRAEDTLQLREAVLRPGAGIDDCRWESDLLPGTFHAGGRNGDAVVGVASVHREPPPWEPTREHSWRLRGMATDLRMRRMGIARGMLDLCVAHITSSGGIFLWCNARTGAVAFYEDFGMVTRGEEFDIPGIGPHFEMWIELDANDSKR